MEDRQQAAEMLREDFDFRNVRLFMDTMDNSVNEKYAALPERLFILYEGKLAYIGGTGPMLYRPSEVEEWLQRFERQIKRLPVQIFKHSQKKQFAALRED